MRWTSTKKYSCLKRGHTSRWSSSSNKKALARTRDTLTKWVYRFKKLRTFAVILWGPLNLSIRLWLHQSRRHLHLILCACPRNPGPTPPSWLSPLKPLCAQKISKRCPKHTCSSHIHKSHSILMPKFRQNRIPTSQIDSWVSSWRGLVIMSRLVEVLWIPLWWKRWARIKSSNLTSTPSLFERNQR